MKPTPMKRMRKMIYCIVDLQYGSTGKGLLAGYMAMERQPDTIITAWGPNAGHTYIDANGRKFVHIMLANGIVSPRLQRVMIGPGSVIDEQALLQEIDAVRDLGVSESCIFIHEHAAVRLPEHLQQESQRITIGSTMKGTGAALAHKISRPTDIEESNVAKHALKTQLRHRVVDTATWLNMLQRAEVIQVEGAQGHSLSIHHGMYPYTTSRDVSTAQIMADCAIPFEMARGTEVIGTLRTYPIRVANREKDGQRVGWSGPHFPDQHETTFGAIGQPTELTTVTKLPRRIFTFSEMQLERAVAMNGVDWVFLNFANYLQKEGELTSLIDRINRHTKVRLVGFGPQITDIVELPSYGV